ncbi:hypothetical protein [Luteimonas abyssi]|uniref:hypothetical protein n=1 Tax=Luteimonas abyssi TaxID=1247514 RepID=UPI00138F8BD7|nr:hypothetical protein [Luteimonas abyssi]
MFLHFLKFICGEGSWSLRPYELLVIEEALGVMDEADASVVRSNLNGIFVDRMSSGRICVIRYPRDRHLVKLAESSYDDMLIEVTVAVEGRKEVAHVTFYRGLLFSVEFKKAGRWYKRKSVKVIGAVRGLVQSSYSNQIDKAEHGRI